MAKLFPWDSWYEMESLKEGLHDLVEGSTCPSPFGDNARRLGQFRPVADVIETEEDFLILVELPGLDREDVFLELHGKELAVSGDRKPPTDRAGAAFQVMERSYGCFSRRFVLPEDADGMGVQARMKSGLLHIRVPKRTRRSRTGLISITVED